MKLPHRIAALALAVSTVALSPSAHALSFVFTDTTVGGMSSAQLAAFQTAANYWSAQLTDDVTVYLNIDYTNTGNNGVLGSTQSTYGEVNYSGLRSRMVADATSGIDALAVASLQTGPTFSFLSNNMDGSTRLNNDTSSAQCAVGGVCDTDNRYLGLTSANAKALGYGGVGTNAANPDGAISFNGYYAPYYQFDRTGGIANNKLDFISVAEHEIGHALGFVSGVDTIDYCQAFNATCGITTPTDMESYALYSPLDLFRYSSNGVRDLTTGTASSFSVDGGASSIASFSTGAFTGNTWQASHFGPGTPNLMSPYLAPGQSYDASARDLAAFDAIGWNLAAVPEPETYALMLTGLCALGWAQRRRTKKSA